MRCAISTACLFPQDTAVSLSTLKALGARRTEVFLNTFSEMENDYLAKLMHDNVQVVSVHPFSSVLEGFLFASGYERRVQDGVEMYRRFFEICNILNTDKLVFHGDHSYNSQLFSMQAYAEKFCLLADVGRSYGVTLCHENVSYCRLATAQSVRSFSKLVGDNAAFVLDAKQARRCGQDPFDLLDAMGSNIKLVHLSDCSPGKDCMLPGKGGWDIAAFLRRLAGFGYKGDLVIELYRNNFEEPKELLQAQTYVEDILLQLQNEEQS